jgi:hypothetical protein
MRAGCRVGTGAGTGRMGRFGGQNRVHGYRFSLQFDGHRYFHPCCRHLYSYRYGRCLPSALSTAPSSSVTSLLSPVGPGSSSSSYSTKSLCRLCSLQTYSGSRNETYGRNTRHALEDDIRRESGINAGSKQRHGSNFLLSTLSGKAGDRHSTGRNYHRRLLSSKMQSDDYVIPRIDINSLYDADDVESEDDDDDIGLLEGSFDVDDLEYQDWQLRPQMFKASVADETVIRDLIREGAREDFPDGLNDQDIQYLRSLVDPKERRAVQACLPKDPTFIPLPGDTYDLVLRQFTLEDEMFKEAMSMYEALAKQLQKMGSGSSQKRIKNYLLNWYGPLVEAITREINSIHESAGQSGNTFRVSSYIYWRTWFMSVALQSTAPYLLMLSPEKQAMIALNTVVNELLANRNELLVAKLSTKVGEAVEVGQTFITEYVVFTLFVNVL